MNDISIDEAVAEIAALESQLVRMKAVFENAKKTRRISAEELELFPMTKKWVEEHPEEFRQP